MTVASKAHCTAHRAHKGTCAACQRATLAAQREQDDEVRPAWLYPLPTWMYERAPVRAAGK